MQLLVFVLILSVLVLIHEAGHFLVAKLFKMKVEEFGIGLPPRAKKLFSKGGTLFSLNWLPIGGFVKLYGEDFEDPSQVANPQAFFNKPALQRAAVLLAGVLMNFILGVILFGGVYSYLGIPTKTDKVIVSEVRPGSPAEMAGLKTDMVIKKIVFEKKDYTFGNIDEFVKTVDGLRGKKVSIVVGAKDGSEIVVEATPRETPPVGEGALGVALSSTEMKKYVWWQMPFRGMAVGLNEATLWGKEIAMNMGDMLLKIVTGKGFPKDVAGPIGIYEVSKEVYKFGLIAVLQFMAILSINLAILNVMPFPALDGGRLVFLVVEKIIGKERKNKIEGYVHMGGMIVLIALMVLITAKDIMKLIWK